VKHTKAQPRFDLDLKFGQQNENDFLTAIEGKVEVKTDRMCIKTGNVYIETESRGKASGVYNTDAKYYAICLYKADRKNNVWVLVPTKHLIKLMEKYPVKAGGDNWTSKGHIVPKEALITFDI
tara:strand:+ start:359 stop:727 length:369 start_codon:yes stop_codon:yes gene_type:complete